MCVGKLLPRQNCFKGILMQISKSANIYCPHMKICWRYHIKALLLFGVSAHELCEKFVLKHLKTLEYVLKTSLLLKKFTNLMGK